MSQLHFDELFAPEVEPETKTVIRTKKTSNIKAENDFVCKNVQSLFYKN
ncbi:hypothetical protein [Xenorhabdus sp. SGI246]